MPQSRYHGTTTFRGSCRSESHASLHNAKRPASNDHDAHPNAVIPTTYRPVFRKRSALYLPRIAQPFPVKEEARSDRDSIAEPVSGDPLQERD